MKPTPSQIEEIENKLRTGTIVKIEPISRHAGKGGNGVVSLKPLYDFVREFEEQNHYDAAKPDTIAAYRIERASGEGEKYRKRCSGVLEGVPDKRGFYLWGFYNSRKFWVNVYFGKSDEGKTAHLKERLYKELTAERAAIWREVNPDNAQVLAIGEKVHPKMWHKYEPHWKRALGKAGSTHIFWVAPPDLSPRSVDPIENDLIEALNPTGNRQRRTPSPTLQDRAGEILNKFRQMVHANRESQFPLEYHKNFWKLAGQAEPPTP